MNRLIESDNEFCLSWAKKIKASELLGGKCEICGNNNIFVMSFHHNEKNKEFNITSLRPKRWSIIEKEIKKCQLLCMNCHAELHETGSRNSDVKKNLLLNRNLIKCSKCEYSGKNFSSLLFHHNDKSSKKFIINNALHRKIDVSVQELEDELIKCSVICANCHAVEHILVDKFLRLKDLIYEKVKNYKEESLPLDEQKIKQMIESGMRQSVICKELNSPKSTIGTIVKRLINDGELNKKEKTVHICKNCKKEVAKRKNNKFCSKKCMGEFRSQKPNKETLTNLLNDISMSKIGEKYGVSRVAVWKWCKSYGL